MMSLALRFEGFAHKVCKLTSEKSYRFWRHYSGLNINHCVAVVWFERVLLPGKPQVKLRRFSLVLKRNGTFNRKPSKNSWTNHSLGLSRDVDRAQTPSMQVIAHKNYFNFLSEVSANGSASVTNSIDRILQKLSRIKIWDKGRRT